MKVVLRNAAECVRCHKVLESRTAHDFRSHDCGTGGFHVDGGREYVRRLWCGGKPEDHFIERSIEVDPAIYRLCLSGAFQPKREEVGWFIPNSYTLLQAMRNIQRTPGKRIHVEVLDNGPIKFYAEDV